MSAEEGLPVDLAPDDLASLPELNDDAVLNGIRTRFEQKKIHTQINNLLVVLNPYQRLPIYSEGLMVEYKAATEGSMPPHVFGTAASSYTGLLAQRSQSIVISGESGAGKSETAKKVLQHLAFAASASKSTGEGDIGIEARILASSPLLEAFGNAKTVMNNNSSRCARAREGRGRGPRGAGRGARGAGREANGAGRGAAVRETPRVHAFHRPPPASPYHKAPWCALCTRWRILSPSDPSHPPAACLPSLALAPPRRRYGKFLMLQFSPDGQLACGTIRTYLLEKTRVVVQGCERRRRRCTALAPPRSARGGDGVGAESVGSVGRGGGGGQALRPCGFVCARPPALPGRGPRPSPTVAPRRLPSCRPARTYLLTARLRARLRAS